MGTKTVAQKRAIKPKTRVWLSHPERAELIGPLPEEVALQDAPHGAISGVIVAESGAAAREALVAQREHLIQLPTLWVVCPKANRADINRDTLWPILAGYGPRPNGQVAVDDVWSALRIRPLKPGEAAFTGGSAK